MAGSISGDEKGARETGAKKPSSKLAKRGISIRKMNLVMAGIIILISVLLIFATIKTDNGFSDMKEQTKAYEEWQQDAYDLRLASDYLTEQVRCFAETGNKKHMDNYFVEANETKRRDKSLQKIKKHAGDTAAYQELKSAMNESVALMDREYYSMRLTCDAYEIKESDRPKEVRNVKLSQKDAAMSDEDKDTLARKMVFDKVYSGTKDKIYMHMNECISDLQHDMNAKQKRITDSFHTQLKSEWILIMIAIIAAISVLILTMVLVVSPLVRAVLYIRAEQAIPVVGSKEFKFLAKTYNMMYEMNKEQKEKLAFEATHDQLTGVYNRSGYDFITRNTDWKTSALMLFDADKFKIVNDTYGHEEGDHILERISETLKVNFRHNDYVCRLGGDEFAVVLTNVNEAAMNRIIEKVDEINDTLMHPDDDSPAIKLSCGVAFGDDDKEYEQLFREADEAMYEIKKEGGGCKIAGAGTDA